MIIVQTAYKGRFEPCFQFEEGDPLLDKCLLDLTLAGIAFRVVSDPPASL